MRCKFSLLQSNFLPVLGNFSPLAHQFIYLKTQEFCFVLGFFFLVFCLIKQFVEPVEMTMTFSMRGLRVCFVVQHPITAFWQTTVTLRRGVGMVQGTGLYRWKSSACHTNLLKVDSFVCVVVVAPCIALFAVCCEFVVVVPAFHSCTSVNLRLCLIGCHKVLRVVLVLSCVWGPFCGNMSST